MYLERDLARLERPELCEHPNRVQAHSGVRCLFCNALCVGMEPNRKLEMSAREVKTTDDYPWGGNIERCDAMDFEEI